MSFIAVLSVVIVTTLVLLFGMFSVSLLLRRIRIFMNELGLLGQSAAVVDVNLEKAGKTGKDKIQMYVQSARTSGAGCVEKQEQKKTALTK